jgi:hypothetical protein
MIRPFDMRDLPLFARVKDRGLCLASQLALTRGPQALQAMLLDAFSGARGPATIVVRSDAAAGIGQLLHRPDQPHARLAFIAPAELVEAAAGIELLEGLVRSAGERGAHHLIAEVDEDSPAFPILRQAGFAIYARQRIWALNPAVPVGDHQAASLLWRPETRKDAGAILSLYASLVPGLVQQVEPPSDRGGTGLVHGSDDELLGYIDIERGPRGEWIQPYFHPAAVKAEPLLAAFLATRDGGRPLYACVRSYQSWMHGALQRLGFEPAHDQAVMVRRMVAFIREPAPAASTALERARAEPTAPFAGSTQHPAPSTQSLDRENA